MISCWSIWELLYLTVCIIGDWERHTHYKCKYPWSLSKTKPYSVNLFWWGLGHYHPRFALKYSQGWTFKDLWDFCVKVNIQWTAITLSVLVRKPRLHWLLCEMLSKRLPDKCLLIPLWWFPTRCGRSHVTSHQLGNCRWSNIPILHFSLTASWGPSSCASCWWRPLSVRNFKRM